MFLDPCFGCKTKPSSILKLLASEGGIPILRSLRQHQRNQRSPSVVGSRTRMLHRWKAHLRMAGYLSNIESFWLKGDLPQSATFTLQRTQNLLRMSSWSHLRKLSISLRASIAFNDVHYIVPASALTCRVGHAAEERIRTRLAKMGAGRLGDEKKVSAMLWHHVTPRVIPQAWKNIHKRFVRLQKCLEFPWGLYGLGTHWNSLVTSGIVQAIRKGGLPEFAFAM